MSLQWVNIIEFIVSRHWVYSEWLMSQPTDIVQSSSCVGLNSLQLLLADFGLIFYRRVVWLSVYIFNTPRQTEPNNHHHHHKSVSLVNSVYEKMHQHFDIESFMQVSRHHLEIAELWSIDRKNRYAHCYRAILLIQRMWLYYFQVINRTFHPCSNGPLYHQSFQLLMQNSKGSLCGFFVCFLVFLILQWSYEKKKGPLQTC